MKKKIFEFIKKADFVLVFVFVVGERGGLKIGKGFSGCL